jgi:hypothetical protein
VKSFHIQLCCGPGIRQIKTHICDSVSKYFFELKDKKQKMAGTSMKITGGKRKRDKAIDDSSNQVVVGYLISVLYKRIQPLATSSLQVAGTISYSSK